MARNKKAALNQSSSVEPIREEVMNTPVEEPTSNELTITIDKEDIDAVKELHDLDLVEEAKEMASEETGVNIDDIKVNFVNDPIPIIIPEELLEEKPEVTQLIVTKPSKAQLAKLSKAGLRWYQRTGMLPK